MDTHAHLNDNHFDADRESAIQRALDAGVGTFIEVAESPEMWEAAIALAERYPFIYASLGIHPHHAHLLDAASWKTVGTRLKSLLAHPKVVAIGEFGLDYFRMQNTKEQQQFICRAQLELAQDMKKPIVIHCRENNPIPEDFKCHADLQEMLQAFYPALAHERHLTQPVGVIHCFSGTWADAQFYLGRGFMLGVDGPATYPSAKQLKENMTRVPLERLVLETDSPYLPPQPYRGQRNEPAYLPLTGAHVAELKHQTADALAQITTANGRALFRLN